MKTQLAIQKFLHNRRGRNLKPKSIQWYEEQLRRFARFCPELPTNPEPVEEFLSRIEGSPETKHAYFRALKALYRFIHKRYGLANPIEQLEPPRCPRKIMPTLESHELMHLLNLAANPRDRTLITVFIDTGARLSELAGLRTQDIKTESIVVNGKSGEREIPISDETRRLLLGLIRANLKNDLVFTGSRGERLSRFVIYRLVRKVMKQAGIPIGTIRYRTYGLKMTIQ